MGAIVGAGVGEGVTVGTGAGDGDGVGAAVGTRVGTGDGEGPSEGEDGFISSIIVSEDRAASADASLLFFSVIKKAMPKMITKTKSMIIEAYNITGVMRLRQFEFLLF